MYWDVIQVRAINQYEIEVWFKDGLTGTIEFKETFFTGVFAHLINPTEFAKVTIFDDVVTWPGHLDLAPDAMHKGIKENKGKWIVE